MKQTPLEMQVAKMFVESGDRDRTQNELGLAYTLYTYANEHMENAMALLCKYNIDYPDILDSGNSLSNAFDRFHRATKQFRPPEEDKRFTESYEILSELLDAAIENGPLWQVTLQLYTQVKDRIKNQQK